MIYITISDILLLRIQKKDQIMELFTFRTTRYPSKLFSSNLLKNLTNNQ